MNILPIYNFFFFLNIGIYFLIRILLEVCTLSRNVMLPEPGPIITLPIPSNFVEIKCR